MIDHHRRRECIGAAAIVPAGTQADAAPRAAVRRTVAAGNSAARPGRGRDAAISVSCDPRTGLDERTSGRVTGDALLLEGEKRIELTNGNDAEVLVFDLAA